MAFRQASLKVLCACKRRSKKNVPADKIDLVNGHIQIFNVPSGAHVVKGSRGSRPLPFVV